jgi:hypothetical protein
MSYEGEYDHAREHDGAVDDADLGEGDFAAGAEGDEGDAASSNAAPAVPLEDAAELDRAMKQAREAAEQKQAQEKDVPPPLTKALIKIGLSQIEKTADGASFGYTRLDLQAKSIRTLDGDLANFKHLKHVNLAQNSISAGTEALALLPSLVTLNLQHNLLTALPALEACHTLQVLQADDNNIASLASFRAPSLFALTLARNDLTSFADLRAAGVAGAADSAAAVFPSVEVLDISFNELTSLAGLADAFPNLKHLNASSNKLVSIAGLQKFAKLETVDLSNNRLTSLGEFAALAPLLRLHTVITHRNRALYARFEEPDELILALLLELPQLRRVDSRVVTSLERAAAAQLQQERAEAAAARLVQEEVARAEAKAEEAALEAQKEREAAEARALDRELAAADGEGDGDGDGDGEDGYGDVDGGADGGVDMDEGLDGGYPAEGDEYAGGEDDGAGDYPIDE